MQKVHRFVSPLCPWSRHGEISFKGRSIGYPLNVVNPTHNDASPSGWGHKSSRCPGQLVFTTSEDVTMFPGNARALCCGCNSSQKVHRLASPLCPWSRHGEIRFNGQSIGYPLNVVNLTHNDASPSGWGHKSNRRLASSFSPPLRMSR